VSEIKITGLRTALAGLPLEKTLRTSIHEISTVYCLLVTLETDAGLTGEGYGFCFSQERLHAIDQFTRSLAGLFVGQDPRDVESIWRNFQTSTNFFGQSGISILAYNPLDVACWDLRGKIANQPLHKLLGSCRSTVPVYASGGLWLSSSIDELRDEARQFVAEGFKAMKMRLGKPRVQDDIERIEAVRDAIGPDITLMADANQGLDASKALRLGRQLERFNLAWFEEPVPTWEFEAAAMLVDKLDVPIASAETEYTSQGIRRMAEAGAAQIFMPDLQRMGGYTEMMRAVQYLNVLGLKVSPHIFTEHSLAIVAAAKNSLWAEHMPWFAPLFNEAMTVQDDGTVKVPDRPGVGFTFNWNKLENFRLK
jgi:L-alanine-DL-glutamate epimerase-like enolase superfamily enzyme